MARRIFMMTVVAITFATITLLLISFSTGVHTAQETSKVLLDFILAALQILAIVFVLIILHDYLRTRRPHRLLFEGVKNEAKLTSAENSPADLDTLAREELVHQFLIIYYELQSFIQQAEEQSRLESDSSQEERTGKRIRIPAFLSDELNFEEAPDTQNLARFFPSLHQGSHDPHDLTITMIRFLQQHLKKVLGDIQVPLQESGDKSANGKAMTSKHSQINAVALQEIMSSAPAEVKPVVGMIDMLVPPRLTKAAAYLQWRGNPRSPQGEIGITLDVSSPDRSTDSLVRTLWQPLQADDDTSSSKGFPKSAERQLTHMYVDLLKPAMRLLVLLFWEQKLISALSKRKFEHGEPMNRQEYSACFIFLFGALYAISGLQFKPQLTFFARLALERFRTAADLHADWETPHCYIGYVYDLLAKQNKDNAKQCEGFISSGVEACDTYRNLAGKQVDKKRKQAEADLQKALLLLLSSKDEELDQSAHLFHEALQQVDPLTYEYYPQQYDVYFYHVACWYGRVEGKKDARARERIEHTLQEHDGFEHCRLPQEARRYLVYSLARSHFLWFAVEDEEDLRPIIDEQTARRLKDKLKRIEDEEAKFSSNYKLACQKGEEFQNHIDKIVKEVWLCCGTKGRWE